MIRSMIRSAGTPPEARGVPRDGVRLLIAREGRAVRHARFADLPAALSPGDLVVVNTSMTEPAALDAVREDGRGVVVHVSGPFDGMEPAALDGARGAVDHLSEPAVTSTASWRALGDDRSGGATWIVELRTPAGERALDGRAGERLLLPDGASVELVEGHPGGRLWRVRIGAPGPLPEWLAVTGRPITYPYLRVRPPISAFRTVFARRDGAEFASAEMPSAGRPFTAATLRDLRRRGVGVVPLVLHTGVASLEAGEQPLPERYRVPAATAAAVNATRTAGGRVVAVGTTVTRALETVAEGDGAVRAGHGWTSLVLGPDRPARVVDGLVTGWHEPEASHLLLLRAVAGPDLVDRAYAAASAARYLWHEFGDSCLLLPARMPVRPTR